jgi:hypothetical protein
MNILIQKKYFFSFSLLLATVLLCCLVPIDALARAGGGSSRGGGILNLILLPFIIIYSAIITHYARKKNKQAKALISKISQIDKAWNFNALKARIEETFFKVQIAWRDRDQDIAKDYMSERLYKKHKIQTSYMRQKQRRNIMENINLKEAKVVEIMDYIDDSQDSFWVYIVGSMIDYTIDDKTGKIIDGKKINLPFKELWRFIRQGDTWVLDEIDQNVTISDLRDFDPFSEEI